MTPIVRNIMALAKEYRDAIDDHGPKRQALRTAIEQAMGPGEPVARYLGEGNEGSLVQLYDDLKKGADLYTTPQPQPKQEPIGTKAWFDPATGAVITQNLYPSDVYTTPQPQRDDTPLLRQALEYLERSVDNYPTGQALSRSCHEDTITALRERLK